MEAMNVIRVAMSLFLVVLIVVAATGWLWTGSHQPANQALASRHRPDALHRRRARRAARVVARPGRGAGGAAGIPALT